MGEKGWDQANLERLEEEGKIEEADRYFKDVVFADPRMNGALKADWLEVYGAFLFRHHKTEKAVEQAKKALEIDPNRGSAHYSLAIAYFKLDKPREAKEAYDKAMELGFEPENPGFVDHVLKGL